MPSLQSVDTLIQKAQNSGGEAYSEKGKRNPIREDTNAILTALVMAKAPRTIVEVGTAYGASALCMALGLPIDGHIETYELSEDVAAHVNAVMKDGGLPIRCIAGRFEDVYTKPSGGIDMLFLDAEKSAYLDHLKIVEADLNPHALIIADNVIDRVIECRDFLAYMANAYPNVTIKTECGLLVATA